MSIGIRGKGHFLNSNLVHTRKSTETGRTERPKEKVSLSNKITVTAINQSC
jgi:hypothetical protein